MPESKKPAPRTAADDQILLGVPAIGPHQLNRITDTLVTVTYPVGATTVLSAQPDGTFALRPAGTAGAYELAICKPDRLIYAPTGAAGPVILVPFAEEIPNV